MRMREGNYLDFGFFYVDTQEISCSMIKIMIIYTTHNYTAQ